MSRPCIKFDNTSHQKILVLKLLGMLRLLVARTREDAWAANWAAAAHSNQAQRQGGGKVGVQLQAHCHDLIECCAHCEGRRKKPGIKIAKSMREKTMTKADKFSLNRRQMLAGGTAAMGAMAITIPATQALASGYPERPISIVVMYGAGGGTDTIMRKLASEMAAAKGWKVNVINKPGAVGAVATNYVHAQAADGYTVLGGANYNKFVRVMGHVDFVPWEEWSFFQAASALASWSVPIDSPFQTFDDVVQAAKANPGSISISTSGTGGLWHELAMIVGSFAGITLNYIPYKGGKNATLAGMQGEVDIAGGGVHEHIELIRAGKMRCLQQTGTEDIVLDDGTVLPTVGNLLPSIASFLPVGPTYNFIMKRDTPVDIQAQVEEAFIAAANSAGFGEMLDKNSSN
ncbi:tripartite tricarboxylate transporter substrate binding protein (plasmid) [Parasedimentitalea marina]|uniref:Tripartite tricarboxylate transporter substrate binding protein n=1 Tax=Parasedimentitalea marina TaxID=2483033 RepID=A0A3T0NA24_9RHOB|nr:tripartite tricarboxylate transporter substrate binding protein [Parasedimentitalea marina]AZV80841.1 tripartite tricarboxylate transporter substrate binding protein [Parasedimentitalea marina]